MSFAPHPGEGKKGMEQPALWCKSYCMLPWLHESFCQITAKYCHGALSHGRILAQGVSFDKRTFSLRGFERLLSEIL